MTPQIVTSFAECRAELQRLRKATSDRRTRRLLKSEIARLDRAIGYLCHRKRR